jgi:hypothetical protein
MAWITARHGVVKSLKCFVARLRCPRCWGPNGSPPALGPQQTGSRACAYGPIHQWCPAAPWLRADSEGELVEDMMRKT